jgi:16S rRNA (guanine527-N7)-methyltransferase
MSSDVLLRNGLDQLRINHSESHINAFMTVLSELQKWNRTYNITSLKTDEEIIIKHFLDSLLYLKALPEGVIKLADIGTGGGFPGIPIKIIRPEVMLTLIEPSRKKISFLRNIVRKTGLSGVTILQKRIEKLDRKSNEFDLIVTRATFSVRDFLDIACPFINVSGRLVISKGPKVKEEIKHAGWNSGVNPVEKSISVRLPFTDAERHILILKC